MFYYWLTPSGIFHSNYLCLQVKEYCPLVFRNLRKRFGIDDASYLKSLTKAPLPMDPPTGRSGGAKYYTSQDHIYTIKTITTEEVEQMHLILKHYHPYVVERHGKTLLPQLLVSLPIKCKQTADHHCLLT